MKERPILFSPGMVRAVLDGRKTQTRRVMKPQPSMVDESGQWYGRNPNSLQNRPCPYGQPGDRLWVREKWRVGAWDDYEIAMAIDYLADNYAREEWIVIPDTMQDQFSRLREQSIDDAISAKFFRDFHGDFHWAHGDSPCRARPSIHMPRWASRILLEITNVRMERLQEISNDDALAEGINRPIDARYPVDEFRALWDSINAASSFGWDANPWVWVVEFRRIS